MKHKARTVFVLRTRDNDSCEWGGRQYYGRRKARDEAGAMARIWLGLRTHSFELKLSVEEYTAIEDEIN